MDAGPGAASTAGGTARYLAPHRRLDGAQTPDAQGPTAPGPLRSAAPQGVRVVQSVSIGFGARLCVSAGSVLDFGHGTDWDRHAVAVVNAANTGGVGGGGVDAVFMARGGEALDRDRLALPLDSNGERIRTGDAVATTCPADESGYGDLFARTVIHAVGPAYGYDANSFDASDAALWSAYVGRRDWARAGELPGPLRGSRLQGQF